MSAGRRSVVFSPRGRGVLYALGAAVGFGGATPFIRSAAERSGFSVAAGYVYLGEAIVLSAWWLAARLAGRRPAASLDRADLAPLVASIVAGGLVAPGAFMAGLAILPAYRVSLLLGLEIVLTLVIALVFRRERPDARSWAGLALLLAAGLFIAAPAGSQEPMTPSGAFAPMAPGVLLIVVACLGWAIDNNVTAGISGKDPVAISLLKGWVAAIVYLGGSLAAARPIAVPGRELATLLTAGAIGYGFSLTIFILALRHIGAALTTGLFSTAPIAGFLASVLLFGETPQAGGWMALALAAAGVLVVARGGGEPPPHVRGRPRDRAAAGGGS